MVISTDVFNAAMGLASQPEPKTLPDCIKSYLASGVYKLECVKNGEITLSLSRNEKEPLVLKRPLDCGIVELAFSFLQLFWTFQKEFWQE